MYVIIIIILFSDCTLLTDPTPTASSKPGTYLEQDDPAVLAVEFRNTDGASVGNAGTVVHGGADEGGATCQIVLQTQVPD